MPYSKYIKKYWKGFLSAILFLSLEATADLMMPTILALIIDRGVANNDLDYVLRMGGIMLLITFGGAIAACARNIIAVLVSQKFGAELRADLFRKIQSLSFDNINQFERASLITRMTNDITVVQNFVGGLMRIFVKAPLLGIGAMILAIRLNPDLSLIFAVVIPVVAVLVAFNMKIGFKRFMKVQQSLDRVNSAVREYLSGVRVIKAFNRFDYEVDRFESTNEEQRSRAMHAMRAMAVFSPAIMLVVNLGIVAILWIGGLLVNNGQISEVGGIIAFISYMTQILFSLMMVSMVFNMFVRAKASGLRINEVFNKQNAMSWLTDANGETPASAKSISAKGKVEFSHVCFSYSGSAELPVLKDVTFTCEPGQTVGIIGSTGSGKSSLVGLIPRFYDATSGEIRVDGRRVKDIDPAILRQDIAIVPQKSILFSGSIEENIKMGNEAALHEDILQAAEMACADDFISRLPEGYDSVIGQKGVNLSGGQKQRVSIARALVRKPAILILDDCTSAVDTATESRIKGALKHYAADLTCILIAQRITSVMDADKIIVMDLGEVVGIGTHSTLIKECRVYQEIYQSQFGEEVRSNVSG